MSRVGLRLTWARSLALLLSSAALAPVAVGCGAEEEPSVKGSDNDVEEDDDDDNESEDDKKAESTTKKDSGSTTAKDAGGNKTTPTKVADAGAKPTGGETGSDSTGGSSSAECEALALVKDKCAGCHDGEGGANTPMGLTSFEDFAKDAPVADGKVYEVSKTRINATGKLMMPPSGLQTSEKAILEKWLSAGAKAGSGCEDKGGEDAEAESDEVWPPPGSECKALVANGPGATVKKGSEPHPQFIFDAPWGDTKVQAVGFRPITDNKDVLHHWILYQNGGSAGGMLSGWAPGGEKTRKKPLPADVGIAMPSGPKSLRLDVHYNNVKGTADAVDASGVEVCWTKELRKYSASTFMGFMQIPFISPGEKKDIIGTCNVSVSEPVYLLSVSPHAHTLATHMKFDVKKKNGTMVNLFDAPFAFEEQQAKHLDEPFLLETGDQVITNCTFNNTTSSLVTFGENTGNEMCFNFAVYYPTGKLSCSGGGGLSAGQIESAFGGGG